MAHPRRHDLDCLRVGAFGLLVLYHVGMFYVTWDFHVKSPYANRTLEPLMLFTNPWRLTLLFLVSGAATRFMADRISAGQLARTRFWRLFPPILLAMLVIVPPQTYFEVLQKLGSVPPVGEFWWRYLTSSGHWCVKSGCIVTPTWNHMWFVVYLLAYTLLVAAMLGLWKNMGARLTAWLDKTPAWAFLAAPAAVLILLRCTLFPRFPVTHAFGDDWYTHSISFLPFLLGFGMAKADSLRERTIGLRWIALAIGLCAYAAVALAAWQHPQGVRASEELRVAIRAAWAVQQWAAIVCVLGFAAKHLRRGGPVLTYLTEAVFPLYIVHQTIIIALAWTLSPLGWPLWLEGMTLVAAALGGGLATYEAVKRVPWLRPWFGLKKLQREKGLQGALDVPEQLQIR
jgi:glucans biosynthesis protein C